MLKNYYSKEELVRIMERYVDGISNEDVSHVEYY